MDASRTYAVNWLNQYSVIPASGAGLQASEFEPQYDDDGNQTLIQTSTGIWTVTYNGENRPVLWERIASDSNTQNSNTQTLVSMSFDRMGRRVSYLETFGSVTNSYKVFTYDGYLQIANSELTTQTSQLFIWDPTEPVATRPLVFYNSNASPQYYTHDGNKNVSDLTDATQSLAAHYAYTPFGTLLSSSGSSSPLNPFRFSSEYSDDALGLVYYNYRHYNPLVERWCTMDILDVANRYILSYNTCKCDFLGLDCDIYGSFEGLCISMGVTKDYALGLIVEQEAKKYISVPPYTNDKGERVRIDKGCCKIRTGKRLDPSRRIVGNGCGAADAWPDIVPDRPYMSKIMMLSGVDFTESCNRHDICYGTCSNKGKSRKAECDNRLREDMCIECMKIPDGLIQARIECMLAAYVYKAAVEQFGNDAYEKAQDEDCAWENCSVQR